MNFNYNKHFQELLTAIGISLSSLVNHYDGLTIKFTTVTDSSGNKSVENNCVIDNVRPKEN